jgi:hypothetical protein
LSLLPEVEGNITPDPLTEAEFAGELVYIVLTGLFLSFLPLLDLGSKSSQLILNSPNPLLTLQHLSQDFPRYAIPVSRLIEKDPVISKAVMLNGATANSGSNLIWMNGVLLRKEDMNPFA